MAQEVEHCANTEPQIAPDGQSSTLHINSLPFLYVNEKLGALR